MTNQNRGCKVTLSHRFTARVQDPLHQKCGRANFGRRNTLKGPDQCPTGSTLILEAVGTKSASDAAPPLVRRRAAVTGSDTTHPRRPDSRADTGHAAAGSWMLAQVRRGSRGRNGRAWRRGGRRLLSRGGPGDRRWRIGAAGQQRHAGEQRQAQRLARSSGRMGHCLCPRSLREGSGGFRPDVRRGRKVRLRKV